MAWGPSRARVRDISYRWQLERCALCHNLTVHRESNIASSHCLELLILVFGQHILDRPVELGDRVAGEGLVFHELWHGNHDLQGFLGEASHLFEGEEALDALAGHLEPFADLPLRVARGDEDNQILFPKSLSLSIGFAALENEVAYEFFETKTFALR